MVYNESQGLVQPGWTGKPLTELKWVSKYDLKTTGLNCIKATWNFKLMNSEWTYLLSHYSLQHISRTLYKPVYRIHIQHHLCRVLIQRSCSFSDQATGWTSEESWFHSRQWQQMYLVDKASKPATRSTQPSFSRVKLPGREADHSSHLAPRLWMEWAVTPFPPTWLHGVHTDNTSLHFTSFYLTLSTATNK